MVHSIVYSDCFDRAAQNSNKLKTLIALEVTLQFLKAEEYNSLLDIQHLIKIVRFSFPKRSLLRLRIEYSRAIEFCWYVIVSSCTNSVFIRYCTLSGFIPFCNCSYSISPLCSISASPFFKQSFVSSSTCFFQFFGRPRFFLPLASRSITTLETLSSSLLSTFPYHPTPIAIANLSTVSFNPSMFISFSVVCLSTTFGPHIAFIIALSVLKVAFHFLLNTMYRFHTQFNFRKTLLPCKRLFKVDFVCNGCFRFIDETS